MGDVGGSGKGYDSRRAFLTQITFLHLLSEFCLARESDSAIYSVR